jgi:hypothetical protein
VQQARVHSLERLGGMTPTRVHPESTGHENDAVRDSTSRNLASDIGGVGLVDAPARRNLGSAETVFRWPASALHVPAASTSAHASARGAFCVCVCVCVAVAVGIPRGGPGVVSAVVLSPVRSALANRFSALTGHGAPLPLSVGTHAYRRGFAAT